MQRAALKIPLTPKGGSIHNCWACNGPSGRVTQVLHLLLLPSHSLPQADASSVRDYYTFVWGMMPDGGACEGTFHCSVQFQGTFVSSDSEQIHQSVRG